MRKTLFGCALLLGCMAATIWMAHRTGGTSDARAAGAFPVNKEMEGRPRATDIGIDVGILPHGALNAITDVPGVRVGHRTIEEETN